MYKMLLAHKKNKNIPLLTALVAKLEKTEEWVDEEDSSKDKEPKGKYLMACIDEFHTKESICSSNTFNADLSQAARDSKM